MIIICHYALISCNCRPQTEPAHAVGGFSRRAALFSLSLLVTNCVFAQPVVSFRRFPMAMNALSHGHTMLSLIGLNL